MRVYPRAGGGTWHNDEADAVNAGRVYPRAGGGTVISASAVPRSGVYPRAGGGTARSHSRVATLRRGSIPARAGEPSGLRQIGLSPRGRGACGSQLPRWVYPRAGGGTLGSTRRGSVAWDTSRVYPRAGGGTAKVHVDIRRQSGGVYPRAGGGTQMHAEPPRARARVYPRAGGGTR